MYEDHFHIHAIQSALYSECGFWSYLEGNFLISFSKEYMQYLIMFIKLLDEKTYSF